MEPVLKDIKTKYPQVTTVHFWSDGPSKQYKNKKNFFLLSAIPPTLGFKKATWNFFPTSHGKGAPDGIGGTVKRTADNLVLRGNDVTDGHTFFEKVSNSLKGVQLHYIVEEDMERYDTLLIDPVRPVPSTRQIHQVIAHENRIHYRQLSYFCSKMLDCQCFCPATFYFQGPDEQQSDTRRARKKRPLNMLWEEMENEMGGEMEEDVEMEDVMEELDEEPLKGPEGTVTVTSVSSLNNGDWLAVVYDDHWWLATGG
ncbi:2-methoxy-6-polyprenyl-14-benzoquinol methylase mitochondrial [Dissostichus eleginoides]|uniref:2-methoxy-6-polyprenyl-14-benzoquinol methylase mitochondrial n=1 Tax=Dissostichus eleginoides TaxID=100907 RepID=A0AAD9CRH2_DISEL|nr:2-methoxy-6-polyprenyl-14-benzoquinol methylase mitochondrial [Dissostichus eleginoides]